MRDPDRLLESSESEVARLLLRAGRERAPKGAKRRALAAATGVIAASTLSAGNAAGAAGAAVTGKATATATTLLSLKWIVVVSVASVGMVAGTVAVGSARTARSASAPSGIAAPARPYVPSARAALSPATPVAPPPVATTDPASAPPVVATVAAPPSPAPALAGRATTPSGKATVATGSTSAAELVLLDQARSAIDAGDPARGLALLDTYASRFPHGVMAPEASVLRIEALVNAGNPSAAKREGEAFLRANPTSPYAARVGSLLGTSNP